MERLKRLSLLDVALAAVITLTVPAEYHWARAAGWDAWNAAAWPVAADAYVLQALRAHKDQLLAMTLMAGSVAAAHILPTEYPHGLPAPILGAAAAVAAGILWRVERLQSGLRHLNATAEAEAAEAQHRLQLEEDARRATAAQEETNRLAAAELEQRRRETELAAAQLAEQEAARKAAERQQRRQPPPAELQAAPGAEDILMHAARRAAETVRARGEALTRDRLRDQMIADGKLVGGRRNERAGQLLAALKSESRRAG
jgi:flagellar biosynthesis GTPase FlhF